MAKKEITRPATVKFFLKDSSDLRVSEESISVMHKETNKLALRIVKKARELCLADKRTTILDRDIHSAFKLIVGETSNSSEDIFKTIAKDMGLSSEMQEVIKIFIDALMKGSYLDLGGIGLFEVKKLPLKSPGELSKDPSKSSGKKTSKVVKPALKKSKKK